MDERTELTKDTRPIRAVWFHGLDAGGYEVGKVGVTMIVAYAEKGQMEWVPWIAVYKGDEISVRFSAEHAGIYYYS